MTMTTVNETMVTFNLAEEVISAELIAKLHGKNETTLQKEARLENEKANRTKQWEKNLLVGINEQLIRKGFAHVMVFSDRDYNRKDIVTICANAEKSFANNGYKTAFFEYAESNKNQWCKLTVIA